MLGEKCWEDIVGMNDCVNVLVGNAFQGKVGPTVGVADVIDQNGYMELFDGCEEGSPIFDSLAGICADDDDVRSGVCSLEFGLDLGEFLRVTAVNYEVEALNCQLGGQCVSDTWTILLLGNIW